MPNFEMYGFEENSHTPYADKIADFFKDRSDETDFVITAIQSKVYDYQATKQPFIRLVSTPGKRNEEILGFLQTLGVDVEFLELSAFFPKKE